MFDSCYHQTRLKTIQHPSYVISRVVRFSLVFYSLCYRISGSTSTLLARDECGGILGPVWANQKLLATQTASKCDRLSERDQLVSITNFVLMDRDDVPRCSVPVRFPQPTGQYGPAAAEMRTFQTVSLVISLLLLALTVRAKRRQEDNPVDPARAAEMQSVKSDMVVCSSTQSHLFFREPLLN